MVDSPASRAVRLPRAALVGALCGLSTLAGAQQPTSEGLARSASLMKQIAETCPGVFDVDRDLASRAQKTFAEVGEKAFGRTGFQKALAEEFARRAQEVRTAGSDRWCDQQREALRDLPGPKIFRK